MYTILQFLIPLGFFMFGVIVENIAQRWSFPMDKRLLQIEYLNSKCDFLEAVVTVDPEYRISQIEDYSVYSDLENYYLFYRYSMKIYKIHHSDPIGTSIGIHSNIKEHELSEYFWV